MKVNTKNSPEKKVGNNFQKNSKVIKKKKLDSGKDKRVNSKIFTKIPKAETTNYGIDKKEKGKQFQHMNGKANATKTLQKPGSDANEKTDWNQFKKEKKLLKIKRKEGKHKDLSTLVKDAKIMYEKLKCRSTEKKDELSEKLFILLIKAGCLQKFVLAHDTSRIVQCLIRYAPPKIREEICLALLPITVTMMQSRYAHFCIIAILKHCDNASISKLIESLYGFVIKLCSHNIAGKIIDTIYFEKASKDQRICLRQEFYSDFLTKSKDLNVKQLKDTYSIVQNSKDFILENVKNKLIHLVNKNAMDNSLVHEILLEYVEECREGKIKEDCDEFLKLCIPVIPHLITTKSGSKCAVYIFWYSPTKERRAIVKTLKSHLLKIFTHEHGHQLILAIVNSLDDTKAIKKSIFDPLLGDFNEVISNQYGRKVLHWFISPADKDVFHPNLINFLEDGLVHSKKEKTLRRNEIFEQIEEHLCEKIQENPKLWLSSGNIGLLTSAFLKHISENRCDAIFKSLAKEIISPEWQTENSDNELGIENTGMHHVLKKILKYDLVKLEKGKPTFAEELLKNLSDDTIELWIAKNRGCFVLVLLFEALREEKQKELINILKSHASTLAKFSHKGSEILLQKIKNKFS